MGREELGVEGLGREDKDGKGRKGASREERDRDRMGQGLGREAQGREERDGEGKKQEHQYLRSVRLKSTHCSDVLSPQRFRTTLNPSETGVKQNPFFIFLPSYPLLIMACHFV